MYLIDLKVKQFIDEVDSNSPAPGGGSVSALLSVLGISLSKMVGHLSINKKKFLKLDESIQKTFKNNIIVLDNFKKELMPLIDADTESFNLIMKAYSLKKDSEEEIILRNKKIEAATIEAIKVPFRVAYLSLEALKVLDFILEYGNKQTISDLGVSVLALSSGIEGAIYNVMINLGSLKNERIISDYKEKSKDILNKTNIFKKSVLEKVYLLLGIE
ncbi:MAG: cyclodeaminase/cyclohydrolase family protein [Bacilli bacterium]|jgi:formiminotetrahydrofolate cyclodeaminase|nr:cyclodeaminase/cyclohydrolase family protein [Bacilli bacterium]MDD4063770.1 cyclodeaminase/cyclohydrolase family protein [Bacilli bacterium]MDD4482635.1 cyclodeaminase/cyclohydrolase family protein [Bacilli bacterium]MDY0363299.1 cyclodeaminase/cyclohydrolase family protein [Bacilli bacterium]